LAKIGDHIRKRRLDLGLLQGDVAAQIGVTKSTVWNWEHGTEPELIHIPAVLAFLGYVPWECPDDPVGRLAYFKKVKGFSYRRLGVLMRRDPVQLEDWLSGRNSPIARNRRMIETFLDGQDGQMQTMNSDNRS
jgi:transcriptional regulator with XRE-family HTH domain